MDKTIIEALVDAATDRLDVPTDRLDYAAIVRDVLLKLAELTPSLRTQEEVRRILGVTDEPAKPARPVNPSTRDAADA